MQTLDFGFWIGLALAIPLSVLGNLATPWFQQYLAHRSEQRSKARISEILRELEEVEELAKNPDLLVIDLLREILFLVFLTAAFGVIVGAVVFLPALLPSLGPYRALAPFGLIATGMIIANYALDATVKARNVRHITKHREVLQRRLKELGHNMA